MNHRLTYRVELLACNLAIQTLNLAPSSPPRFGCC